MDGSPNSAGGTGLMDRVRQGATTQLGNQKDKATDGLGSVAEAVRQTTQHLREQRHETIARYVDEAAAQLERVSQRLREKNVGEMLDDAQEFARRRPAVFIGTAFALGMISARFFKSSRDRRADDRPTSGYGTSSETRSRAASSWGQTGVRPGSDRGQTPTGRV
jgi:ElaB/YqjD/DUF883 family membrane-anchored ribosome-binding protein